MPDKDNPAKQIPDRPAVLPGQLEVEAVRPGTARGLGAEQRRDAGRLVHHRPGQPLVRQGVHQPDVVRPDGRGLLRADRRHRARAHAQGRRGARAAGRPVAERAATTSAGCIRTILNTAGLSAAGPVDGQRGRQDAVRLGLPQPAPRRPGLRCPGPGPGPAAGRRRQPRSCPPRTATARTPARRKAEAGPGSSLGDPKRAAGQPGPAKKGAAKKAAEAAGLPSPAARRPGAAAPPGRAAAAFDRLFGVDPSVANDDVLGTIPQALFLMNSPLVNGRIAGPARHRPGRDPRHGARRARRPERAVPARAVPAAHAQGGRDLRPIPGQPSATAARRSKTSTGA